MTISLYIAYLGAVFLISGTPGPNMLLAMTHGIHHGLAKAVPTMAGLLVGLAVILSVSLGGLGAVLLASSLLFTILKFVGAAYLVYLGVRTWRGAGALPALQDAPTVSRSGGGLARFRSGVMVSLSNPKAILFGVAFFPQFIDPAKPLAPQAALLIASFALIETSWMTVYAGGGSRLAVWLRRGGRMRWFNRAAGSAFVGAGLLLGSFRR
jgi:threonine/homoserine/homoserine lactone efflux protein